MQPDLELPGSVKAQRSTPNKDAKRSGADDTEADESQAEACAQLFQVEEWRGGGGSRCMDVTRRIVCWSCHGTIFDSLVEAQITDSKWCKSNSVAANSRGASYSSRIARGTSSGLWMTAFSVGCDARRQVVAARALRCCVWPCNSICARQRRFQNS